MVTFNGIKAIQLRKVYHGQLINYVRLHLPLASPSNSNPEMFRNGAAYKDISDTQILC